MSSTSARLASSVLAILPILAIPAARASAQTTIFDDTAMGPNTSALSLSPADRYAKPFVPTTSAIATEATLVVAGVVGVGTGSFTLEIRTDSGGDPGALLATATGARDPDDGPGSVTVALIGAPMLDAGATYYAVFYANAGNWAAWYHSSTMTEGVRVSGDGGASWGPTSGTDARRLGLRVRGTMPAPDGTACIAAAECTSGNCVDGFCCDMPCGGGVTDCQACSITAGGTANGACGALRADVAPATTCRGIAGGCDVAESCTSTSTACPPDVLVAMSTECRGASGACDVAESCTGTTPGCPEDAFAADGTACADALVCDGDEVCAAGACGGGAAPDCDDGDACTADACAEPGGCASVAIPGCVPGEDAGTGDADAGATEDDAGVPGEDAAIATDAGGVRDAGGGADSGMRADAGGPVVSGGGCACAAPASRRDGAGGIAIASIALLGLALRRRRR